MRAAIVGCGGIAQVHAKVLDSLKDVTLAAFADIVPQRAQKLADTYGGKSYDSLETMLEKERIDVLHICTPHFLHTPMAARAAEEGINIFTEKPPVISREQLADFSALAEKVHIGICFQNRYNPSVRYLKSLLDSGVAGGIKGARAFVTWSRNEAYYTESGWRGKLATEGGGALINQAIHTLDLLTELLGAPSFVEAQIANHHLKGIIEVEDTLEAYIDFHGCPSVFYATTAYCDNAPVFLELACERATLRIEETEVACWWNDGRKDRIQFDQPSTVGKDYWGNGHYACISDYYDCLRSGRPFPIGIPEIRTTMNVMLGIYESAQQKQVIYF
jgi:predicted dehydrogenase